MPYESLLNEAYRHDIDIYEKPMKPGIKGLYSDNIIWINKNISTSIEKACVLAEEIGHYHTSIGDILDQTKLSNIKQEKRARKWASERLVTPKMLVEGFEKGCISRFEIADFLNVTELFLDEALKYYRDKYGTEIQVNKKHTLYLDPLSVYVAI